ncbi:putative endonuclease Exonuclease phosphatase [Rosellinia necatrix]|uniref:polynucleotide adenylyltransferase n=1 Tax=Rosellinia necatrix TaxID=77044 RepID=A0A1W2TE02_ROSNE|nr:putative endonuclease Exonuclease phosphatase [Rosellinia necatrix]
MAAPEASLEPGALSLDSHDTALCIIPPRRFWPVFDHLRSLYDKAYEKWPPHINLVYPYVRVESLPRASALVASQMSLMSQGATSSLSTAIRLDAADVFPHKRDNTIFVYDSDKGRTTRIRDLRRMVLTALATTSAKQYRMHMTIGQSQDPNSSPHKFLLGKASVLPTVEWDVQKLCILVRERMEIDGNAFSRMRVWGTIDLTTFVVSRADAAENFDDSKLLCGTIDGVSDTPTERNSHINFPYTISDQGKWVLYSQPATQANRQSDSGSLTIASYNVLAEFKYPPSTARYPFIVRNILQPAILSDVLVLQEVTDDFLSFICQNNEIREHYRFVSHGPPDQDDIEPLPSHLNVVVFSRRPFTWSWLSFYRRHKGSMIVKFMDIGKQDGDIFIPTILSTVHLTCGLTDGSVSSKKLELQALVAHLLENHPQNPWIVAGDFNITTSAYTIETAFKKKAISSQTVAYLKGLENILTNAGLVDAWTSARVRFGDLMDSEQDLERQTEIFEGEQGATFDPTVNDLAADIVGSGFNNRPQRYDRILVKGEDFIVTNFATFGRKPAQSYEGTSGDFEDTQENTTSYASDHWGVRCSVKINRLEDGNALEDASKLSASVQLRPAPEPLSNVSELKSCLDELDIFPSQLDAVKRKEALELLRAVVLDNDVSTARGNPTFVLVPVGSYGLGVWSASSDIDCLCIGPISAKTFFTLATQRIRKAEDRGIRLRRRVNAHSGIMLELEVLDVKMDLQYCPSTSIAETWPHVMRLPASDPIFALPTQTLAKLKPARDMYYIRRTIPDYAAFRTAYHLIRYWAKQRGLYSAKFGLLSGIQISVLLSRVCKLLSHDGVLVSLPSILTTFFHHYSQFDWNAQVAFDPFFHKQLRYVRTAREPIAILGFHPPSLNTALNASLPSVRTISSEFERANKFLSQDGMTWTRFLSENHGPTEFLVAFKTFIKIDAQFWGVSLAKGSGFVGWLESRCVMLLVDLNRRLPGIHARIWPARFVNEDVSGNETDYQGYYLIGLDKYDGSNGAPMSKDDMKATLSSLHAALQKFEGQIRGDEKYFNSNTSWMSASLINRSELGTVQLDSREWGEYTVGDDEFDEEEEEEDEEEDMLGSDGEGLDGLEALHGKSKSRKGAITANRPPRPAYSGKFRSSADVINRIRWDPNMDSGDYIVGYEDRFLGTKERALDAWKSEQTDEEFIPQHRILYFKRKSDGAVVWDRKERRDTVFGSGVSSIDFG